MRSLLIERPAGPSLDPPVKSKTFEAKDQRAASAYPEDSGDVFRPLSRVSMITIHQQGAERNTAVFLVGRSSGGAG